MKHAYLIPLLATPLLAFPQKPGEKSEPTRAELEQKFATQMSGCQMVGKFTTTGSKKPAQEDRYTISKVTKVEGDRWRFHAKIEYAGRSLTVPVPVEVKWAGDTPMIQVTDLAIPVLGTYSARVLIYRGEYAGTWSGANHGGQMFGKIVPVPAVPAAGTTTKRQASANWGNWRGPGHDAISPSGKPPTTWDEEEGKNIKWKTPLPGRGSSSPLVWGDRVYVTTAIPTDEEGEAPATGGRRPTRRGGFGGSTTPTKIHEFAVLAFERETGKPAWKKIVKRAVPHEGGHATSTQASNSSITDGEHIYAYFGSRGLHCLSMDGEVQWSKDFGTMRTAGTFGEGNSPTLHGDTLVVLWDHEGTSFLAALDKTTGEEKWRKPRRQGTTWATPLVVDVDGRPQIVVPGSRQSRGYDLKTGEEIWSLPGLTSNPIPSPLYQDGIAYLMSGFRGSALQAVRLAGAKGDLAGGDKLLWSFHSDTPYTPTGIVYDGFLYFLRVNSGVLSCLDAKTGKVHYKGKRLRRIGDTYSSIVGANKNIYITSRRGWTKVLRVGPEFEEIANNRVRDTVDATAAIAGDEIFLRGWETLYCIAATDGQ